MSNIMSTKYFYEMLDYIDQNNIQSFSDFCRYARKHNSVWFEQLCFSEVGSTLIQGYIEDRAKQQEKKKREETK